MKANAKKTDKTASWDKDSQKLKIDRGTPHGRHRFWVSLFLKLGVLVGFALIVYLAVLGVQLYQSWQVQPEIVKPVTLPTLVISGNSSLPSETIEAMVIQVIEPNLAAINPYLVKQTLESKGQVKSANVEKDFPNHLKIHITERLPVLMLAALDAENQVTFWAVDEEGTIYKPYDLQRMKALELPFVEGVQIARIEDGLSRIEGIDKVHYLLQLLKRDAYAVFNDVKSVSMIDYNGGEPELGAVIILRGQQLKKVIFGVENFEYQVVKLIGVLSVSGKVRLSQKNVIDLSYSGDAIVR